MTPSEQAAKAAQGGDGLLQEARGWQPQDGEQIEGTVAGLERGWSDFAQGYYPIVVLELASGERVALHAFHHALRQRLEAAKPKVGDALTVRYHGKRKTKDEKRTAAVYSVKVGGEQDSAGYWDSMESAPAEADVEPE